MDWTPTVTQIQDGTEVSAATINAPIGALINRTQYLYDAFVTSASRAQLIARSQRRASGSGVTKNSVVYYDGTSGNSGLKLAFPKLASLDAHPFFRGADSSHVFGVVSSVSGEICDVVMQGLLSDTVPILSNFLDGVYPGFVSGPLYLSGTQAGKLTPTPNGLAVFVAYAKSLNELYINPSADNLASLFWSFNYSILDRPAVPFTKAGQQWLLDSATTADEKVGWIKATDKILGDTTTLEQLFPVVQPKYYYQLPNVSAIVNNNVELTPAELLAAKNLRLALPIKQNNLAVLTVNGVTYAQKTHPTDNGSYVLNDYGLWWFSEQTDSNFDDGEFDQPWSKDLYTSLRLKTTSGSSHIQFLDAAEQVVTGLLDQAAAGFYVGAPVTFFGTFPLGIGIAGGTNYVIKEIGDDYFTVATAIQPTIEITLGQTTPDVLGNSVYLTWKPEFWGIGKGSTYNRPAINLEFTKLNPDVRQNVVSSLQADPSVTTPAIQISSLLDGTAASTGDLKLKLTLPVTSTPTTGADLGTAIKGLSYNDTTERLDLLVGPVVSGIKAGGGLKIDADPATGIYTLSFASAYSNSIPDVEPEQARMEYFGLNSYLALEYSTTPNGFIGKFLLPDQLITASGSYLNIILSMFGKAQATTTRTVRFKFEYNVAKLGERLTSTTTSIPSVEIQLPQVSNSTYPAYHVFETPITAFRIPIAELAGKATVNFRIHRLKNDPLNGLYTNVIGVQGMFWSIS